MAEETLASGKITIDPEVLETIARMTTLAVPGVARLTAPLGIQRMLGLKDGIQIAIHADRTVTVNLHVVVESGRNMLALGRQIQSEVTRAIEDIAGMEVEAVNVYIEDVVPTAEED